MPGTDLVPVSLSNDRSYGVHFRALDDVADLLTQHLPDTSRCLVISDENVAGYYLDDLFTALDASGLSAKAIVLPPGEATKSAKYLQHIYDTSFEWGIDRQTAVLGLGGGVVGDIAGFAAATLLRGLPLIHVPTSVIAQVDSSIGGKTGINHEAGKNLIGAFYQPEFVLTDVRMLATLPERQWMSGLAEVVKHALIGSSNLFNDLRTSWDDLQERSLPAVRDLIPTSAAVKADIVSQDERESGIRAVLNFGHTYAHAIERVAGYGAFTHGEAVAVGMAAALRLSQLANDTFDPEPALTLTRRIPLQSDPAELDFQEMYEVMLHDKKTQDGNRRFILLREIGEPYISVCNDKALLAEAWHSACTPLNLA